MSPPGPAAPRSRWTTRAGCSSGSECRCRRWGSRWTGTISRPGTSSTWTHRRCRCLYRSPVSRPSAWRRPRLAPSLLLGEEMPALDVLASVLGCYGLIDRRTALNWNEDSTNKLRAAQPVWSRPTASGGGMYPAESYLVAGPSAPVRTGVYHYDTAHHSLDRLSAANRCSELAAATGVSSRPLPGRDPALLEERLQIQLLQLSRGDPGRRRAARLLAARAGGRRPRSRGRPVVRRSTSQYCARRGRAHRSALRGHPTRADNPCW